MRRLILFASLCFGTLCFGLNINEILSNIKTDDIVGKFNQTKQMQGFKKPLVSSGDFGIKNGVFMQNTTKPLQINMKVDKSGVYEYDGKNYHKIDGLFDENLFLDMLSLNVENLKKHFEVELQGDKQKWRIKLKPKNFIAKIFESIEINGDKFIKTLILVEVNKDTTHYEFFDVR